MTRNLKHVLPAMLTDNGCPLCDCPEIIEVVTQIKLSNFIVPNYRYSVCENSKCEFEYVTHEQAKHNDEDKLNEN